MTQYYGKTKHGRVWHRMAYVRETGQGWLYGHTDDETYWVSEINGDTITTKLPPGAVKCRRCWRG